MADLAKAFAVCVFMCAMIFRLPIWAPQYATLLRIFIIFLYYITRRVRVQKGYVFSLQGDAASSAESKQTNDVVPKARVAHDAKRSLILAVGFQIVFVALAAISYVNNTLIKCAYRETLSLRELVVIAVKEHGQCCSSMHVKLLAPHGPFFKLHTTCRPQHPQSALLD